MQEVVAAQQAGDAAERARALILFCDGLEAGGLDDYARRARDVARDVLELAEQLEAERSTRLAAFAERDRWQQVALRYSQVFGEEPGPDG